LLRDPAEIETVYPKVVGSRAAEKARFVIPSITRNIKAFYTASLWHCQVQAIMVVTDLEAALSSQRQQDRTELLGALKAGTVRDCAVAGTV
jgi:hypothetical protein